MPLRAWFKLAVFGLLALNAAVFARAGTPNEALDSIAWFVLLVLFEAETRASTRFERPGVRLAVRSARLCSAIAVGIAAIGYVHDAEWMDAINAWIWIAVVALLELEVRRPQLASMHRAEFTASASVLYAGLGAVVGSWAWQGLWFDAYDALLWLVAFAAIEINLLDRAWSAALSESATELCDKA